MTRKDWWLGIAVVLLALIIQTLVIVRAVSQPSSARHFKFWPLAATVFRN